MTSFILIFFGGVIVWAIAFMIVTVIAARLAIKHFNEEEKYRRWYE